MMNPTASSLSAPRFGAGRSAPSSPLSPWTKSAGCGSASSGRIAPGVHRRRQVEQIAHHERVVGGPVERCVARHRRDPDQVGELGGHEDGDGVVVAGVAVEQDPGAVDRHRVIVARCPLARRARRGAHSAVTAVSDHGPMAIRSAGLTSVALVLGLVVAGCSGGGDEDAAATAAPVGTTAQEAATSTGSAPNTTPIATLVPVSNDPPGRRPRRPSPPTTVPEATGVPGLDSADAFCAAWSRFGGTWQVALGAGAFGGPAESTRLEVIAAPVVGEAYTSIFGVWPADLGSEQDVVADAYFGAFQRRSADASAAARAGGGDAGATRCTRRHLGGRARRPGPVGPGDRGRPPC